MQLNIHRLRMRDSVKMTYEGLVIVAKVVKCIRK